MNYEYCLHEFRPDTESGKKKLNDIIAEGWEPLQMAASVNGGEYKWESLSSGAIILFRRLKQSSQQEPA